MQVNNERWSTLGITIITIVVTALICIPAFAQKLDLQVLGNAAMEIRIKNRKVTDALLANDQKVITPTFPAIRANLAAKGFSEADINAAVSTGWKNLRSPSSPLVPFDESAFVKYVTKLGRLKIETIPAEANIDIDGSRQDEKTDTAKWLAPKRYRIILKKAGYFPEEEERSVVEGDNPPLSKTLRPRPAPGP